MKGGASRPPLTALAAARRRAAAPLHCRAAVLALLAVAAPLWRPVVAVGIAAVPAHAAWLAAKLDGSSPAGVTMSLCCAPSRPDCCALGTLTQLRVSLGSRAHTVLWRCSHATRPALFVMPHPPRAANESSYNARITVLFMDFTRAWLYSIQPLGDVSYVGAMLANVTLAWPAATAPSVPSRPRAWSWVHFLGDSVTRGLHTRSCEKLGMPAPAGEGQNEKEQLLCVCCGGGRCLSWERWWYEPNTTAGNKERSRLPHTALCDWGGGGSYACHAKDAVATNRSQPDLLYLSFGSHAPQANVSPRTMLDFGHLLEGAPYPVVLGATTAVAELLFPDRYQGQLAERNSLRITAINNAAHFACSSLATCRWVDLFALTFAAVDLPGSFNPGDPLHPTWPLSSAAAALVLDALGTADEPDDVTMLGTHSSGFILQS